MHKVKKALSVVLTVVMLFTTLCFFPLDLGVKVNATTDATAINTGNAVAFWVPEVIYLAPHAQSWTASTTSTFQYYVENTVNTGNIYSLPTTNTNQNTTGSIYFAAENIKSGTTPKILATFADYSGNDKSGGSFDVTTLSATGNYFKATINGGTSPSLSASETGCYIKWTVQYTNSKDENLTAVAYSYVYKPYVIPFGAAVRAQNRKHNDITAQHILWISGVHSITPTTQTSYSSESAGDFYLDPKSPRYGDSSYGMIGFLSNTNSAFLTDSSTTTGVQSGVTSSTTGVTMGAGTSHMYAVFAGTHFGIPTENSNAASWFDSSNVGIYTFDQVNYQRDTGTGSNKILGLATSLARGNLAIDVSRYSNLSQIPNLGIGFLITDENTRDYYAWHVADATNISPKASDYWQSKDSYSTIEDVWGDHGDVIASQYNNKSMSYENMSGFDSNAIGLKYAGVWPKAISGTGNNSYAVQGFFGIKCDNSWNTKTFANSASYVTMNAIQIDKSALRTAVNTAITKFGKLGLKDNWGSVYYDATSAEWKAFVSAYKEAAIALMRVDTNTTDYSSLISNLNNTISVLESGKRLKVYFDVNYGGINPNLWVAPATNTSGAVTYTWDNANQTVTLNGTATADVIFGNTGFSAASSGDYTFSTEMLGGTASTNGCVVLEAYDIDGNYPTGTRRNFDFTATKTQVINFAEIFSRDTDLMRLRIWYNGESTNPCTYTNNSYRIKVERGNTKTAYSPAAIITTDATYGTLPETTRTGYTFSGWYLDKECTQAVSSSTAVTSNILYAKWTPKTYTITYDDTVAEAQRTQQFTYGDNEKFGDIFVSPTRENYAFTGWVDANGTKVDANTLKPASNLSLYSTWVDANYYIAFDGNGNTNNVSMDTVKANIGENFTLPENAFTRTGYTFLGWSRVPSATEATYSDKAAVQLADKVSTVTLYAVWAKNAYTVNYVGGEGATGTVNPTNAKYDEEFEVKSNNYEKPGYLFKGWDFNGTTYQPGDKAINLTTAQNGSVTFTAIWEPITYTVHYTVDGKVVKTETVTYDGGAALNDGSLFSVTGYTFGGWTKLDGTPVTGDMFDNLSTIQGAEVTLTADKNVNEYTVVYVGGDGAEGEMASQIFEYTDTVNLLPLGFTKTGYTFLGWMEEENTAVSFNDAQEGIDALTSEPDGVVYLYARWQANTYKVDFHANNENATGEMTEQFFAYDEAQNLTENKFEVEGYHFIGWATSADGEVAYSDKKEVINLTATQQGTVDLYAKWEIDTFTVTFNYKNVDGTDANYTQTVDWNTAATAPEIPQYYFTNTDKDGKHSKFTSWDNEFSVITADTEITAQYEEEAHKWLVDSSVKVNPTCTTDGVEGYVCNLCNAKRTEILQSPGHDWKVISDSATCQAAGYVLKECNVCHATAEDDSPKKEHTSAEPEKENEIPVSCISNGSYDLVTRCSKCNELISSESITVTAEGHKFGETVPATDAKCGVAGNHAYKQCTVCQKFFAGDAGNMADGGDATNENFIISALEHISGEAKQEDVKAPDCLNDGSYNLVTRCTLCNEILTSVPGTTPAEGHKFGTIAEANAPSCTQGGNEAYKQCSVCNKFFAGTAETDSADGKENNSSFLLSILGHKEKAPVEENEVLAGCLTEGSYDMVVYCETCGEKLSTEHFTIPATGHEFINEVTANAPTCTEKGNKAYKFCDGCDNYFDAEITDEFSTAGTKNITDFDISAEGHKMTLHEAVASDCLTDGNIAYYNCSVCKKNFEDKDGTVELTSIVDEKDGHIFEVKEEAKEATCLETGWTKHYECTECKTYFADNTDAFAEGLENDSSFVIAAKNHTFGEEVAAKAPTCSATGNDAYIYCAQCDKYFEPGSEITSTAGKNLADFTIAIAPEAHKAGEAKAEDVQNATCTVPGTYNLVVRCTLCNKVLSSTAMTQTTPHVYEREIKTELKNPATCITLNEYYLVCNTCDKTSKDEAPEKTFFDVDGGYNASNHAQPESGTLKDVVDATCTTTGFSGNIYYDCCNTVKTPGDVTAALGHTWGETVAAVPATCTVGGRDAYKQCTVCEDYFAAATDKDDLTAVGTKDINYFNTNATKHVFENEVAYKAPGCLTLGNEAYKFCDKCDLYFAQAENDESLKGTNNISDFDIQATGHTFSKKQDYVDSDCLNTGWNEHYECTVCNTYFANSENKFAEGLADTKSFVIAAKGHDFINEVGAKEPTCTEKGNLAYKECSRCDGFFAPDEATNSTAKKDSASFFDRAATKHVFTDHVDGFDAECEKDGLTAYMFCDKCDLYFAQTENDESLNGTANTDDFILPALEHVLGNIIPEVPANCVDEGTIAHYVCELCKATFNSEKVKVEDLTISVDENNHKTLEVVKGVAPTCTVAGLKDGEKCTACGDITKEQEVDPALGHDYTAKVTLPNCTEQGYTTYTCTRNCGEENAVYVGDYVSATGHDYGTLIAKVPATCKTTGTIAHYKCSVCNLTFNENKDAVQDLTIEIDENNHVNLEEIPAVASTCTTSGLKAGEKCSDCGDITKEQEVDPVRGHTWGEWKTVTEPSCTAEGLEKRVCMVDDSHIGTNVLKKTAHTPGDPVIENRIPATAESNGSYETVIDCTVCGGEISRVITTYEMKDILPGLPEDGKVEVDVDEDGNSKESLDDILGNPEVGYESSNPDIEVDEDGNIKADEDATTTITVTTPAGEELQVQVSVRTVKKITFIMKENTVVINAYNGDTVKAPEVPSYTGETGFVHTLKYWAKGGAQTTDFTVNGDATYVAVYTKSADYSEFDDLEATLKDILEGGLADDSVIAENQSKIDSILTSIDAINNGRPTRDDSRQGEITLVVDKLEELITIIYPDAGSTLEIAGGTTFYTGTYLDLKAIKMPVMTEITDAEWVSSDDSIVFFSNGRLFAVGTGTVTLTATRGILKASKTVTIVEGGDARTIKFTAIDKMHFIVEDYFSVYQNATLYWSDSYEIRFRVHVYQTFAYETYLVYVNGEVVEPDADGYYTIPAESGNIRVAVAGAMYGDSDDGSGTTTKFNFWEWLLAFFRKIIAFFTGNR